MGTLIAVNGLSKSFLDSERGEIRAVDDISFEVQAGEVFGLLGPNGAGKTTTLRMIATVLVPTTGTILLDGCDVVAEAQKVRSRLGFLSGTTSLYQRLNVEETLAYFGRLAGMTESAIHSRSEELIASLGLGEYRKSHIRTLSTGFRQRVNIARTLIHDPPVVIFDEPTTGLDTLTSRTLVDYIRTLAGRGRTVLYSTHIMREAERICDRIAVIHHGRILLCSTLTEILARTGTQHLDDAFFRLIGDERESA